jgi:Tol biopolymer transport system component
MSRPRRRAAALALAVLPALAAAPAAQARWTQPVLVSASPTEQAQAGVVADEVDVSADGRYVVFRTGSRNLFDDPEPPGAFRQGGIFRKDLLTGALALVAPGNVVSTSDPTDVQVGAQHPSISADGRYIAFDTAQALVPADDDGVRDVYVRDMALAPGDPGAYTLASASDGADGPLAYDPPASGSIASAREAISDDGRRVAFVARDPLAGAPAGQVLVRDLDARRTTLVSVARDGATPAGDAVGGAVLSGDGTTVAWPDANVAAQAPVVGGEQPNSTRIVEYLWRRVADGAAASTRRVTGAGDPDDPACPPGGSISSASGPVASPCDGPFQTGSGGGTGTAGELALSGDGREVAFVATPVLRGLPQPVGVEGTGDLFVADMRPGRSRKQALTEVTRASVNASDDARSAAIVGLGLSGDGRYLAFGTARIAFLLPRPTLVGAAASVFLGAQQVYVADLAQGTMELVTRAFDGGDVDANDANAAPALSADGGTVAFGSAADRLVPGDGNSAADAFVARRVDETSAPLAQQLPAGPPAVAFAPLAILRAAAVTRRGGVIAVNLIAPGTGALDVRATLGRATLGRLSRARVRAGETRLLMRIGRAARRRATRSKRRLELRVRLVRAGAPALVRVAVVRRGAW